MEKNNTTILECEEKRKNRLFCSPKDKNLIIITVSGGEYEAYWETDYLCPKNKLQDIINELKKAREWFESPGMQPDTILTKLGCKTISISSDNYIYKGYEGELEVD